MADSATKTARKGPPAVRDWWTLNPKRDGSPCVLKRKFGYVKTHYNKLADAEAKLAEAKKLPEGRRRERKVEDLTDRVENRRAWLQFSVDTLRAHCHFAVARYTGELERVNPSGTGKKRGVTPGKKKAREIRKLVTYFEGIIPVYLQCLAVAEGTSDRDEAMESLMTTAKPVVEVWKRKSGREADEAEQLAWIEIITTAKKFDPTSSNMSQFNTYFSWRARRATQIRKDSDCPPGRQRIKGKIVTRGTIHMDGDDGDTAAFHPTVEDDHNNEAKSAVHEALAALSETEREIAVAHLMEGISLRKLAEIRGETVHAVRKQVNDVKDKLRGALSGV